MTAISRVTQKIFGTTGNVGTGGFGAAALGNTSTEVATSQTLATIMGTAPWASGWDSATLGSSKFPAVEDMNALTYTITTQLAYLFQQGIPDYDAGTTYYIDSIVKKPSTTQVYYSLTNGNIGNALTDGANWAAGADLSKSAVPLVSVKKQKFTTSGTYTPSTGMLYCIIECLGGGAAGGGVALSSTFGSAGGGGSGSYSKLVATAATIGSSQSVSIGAGGTAGTAGNNPGGNGGDTSVGTLCIGKGGTGGGGSAANARSGGGFGGVAGTGDLTGVGATGMAGLPLANGYGGRGGDTLWGSGGVETPSSSNGFAGLGYGAGGSGGFDLSSGGNRSGGAGTPGIVFITEYCSQ